MIDLLHHKERYMQDALPIRLGGIAADLARIKSFSDISEHCEVVKNIVKECRFLIEWTAPDAKIDVGAVLAEIQLQLSLWLMSWEEKWSDPIKRSNMAKQSGKWSGQLLDISGLLH